MWLAHALGLAAAAAGGAALVAWERRRAARADAAAAALATGAPAATTAGARAARRAAADAAAASALAADLGPAAAGVPLAELRPLAELIRAVHAARGWRGSPYLFSQAWARAEARAAGGAGGGWEARFEPGDVTAPRLAALAAVIDEELLGGLGAACLLRGRWDGGGGGGGKRKRRAGGGGAASGGSGGTGAGSAPAGQGKLPAKQREQPPEQQPPQQQRAPPPHPHPPGAHHAGLGFRVVNEPRAGWLAHYDPPSRAVVVNAPRWAKDVSRGAPANCEGVVVTSRRGILLHTIGHEVIHAIVEICFPEIDAASPAYLGPDGGRHGPVFKLLNRQLLGHASEALEPCDARAALGGGGGGGAF
jgi:hypothetical protein